MRTDSDVASGSRSSLPTQASPYRQLQGFCTPRTSLANSLASTRLAGIVCLIILSCYCYHFVNQDHIIWVLKELQSYPVAGMFAFVLLAAAAIVLLFPAMLLALVAGAMYGISMGFLTTWVATVLGQSWAFLVGRYLLRDFVVSWLVSKIQNFHLIEEKIAYEGWRLVVLLRLSPLIPYNVLNYLLSITPISFWSYTLSSAFSIIPYTISFVYIGSMSHDLTQIFSGQAAAEGLAKLGPIWMGASMLMLVATVVYASIIAKSTLQALLQQPRLEQDPDETTACIVQVNTE